MRQRYQFSETFEEVEVELDELEISLVNNLPEDENLLIQSALSGAQSHIANHTEDIISWLEKSYSQGLDSYWLFERCWIPAGFNIQDAWMVAETMIDYVLNDNEVMKCLHSDSLPEGFVGCEKVAGPLEVAREERWLEWKRKGLEFVEQPFLDDVCRFVDKKYVIRESNLSQWIQWGIEKDFFVTDDNLLGINEQAYAWLDKEYKYFFFQRSKPLGRYEFFSRMNPYIFQILKVWLSWTLSSGNFLSPTHEEMTNFLAVESITEQNIDQLFEMICRIITQDQDIKHQYFGEPSEDYARFILWDTKDPRLMFFFRPEEKNAAKARKFEKNYLLSMLKKDRPLFEAIFCTFEDYCIYNRLETEFL